MKIRQGFVSNSSSSSFILASKNTNPELKVQIEVDISSLVRGSASTIEELNKYLVDEYSEEAITGEDDYYYYKECIEAINSGKTVFFGTASSEGEGYEVGLCYSGFGNILNPEVEIIEDCEGY